MNRWAVTADKARYHPQRTRVHSNVDTCLRSRLFGVSVSDEYTVIEGGPKVEVLAVLEPCYPYYSSQPWILDTNQTSTPGPMEIQPLAKED